MLYAEEIFTPDKGIRFRVTSSFARNWLGSDYDYQQLDMYANVFFQPFKPWVCGFMGEWNMMSEDAPFYVMPYLTMRGLPAAKYQGASRYCNSRQSSGSTSAAGGAW
jgi:hypothetical protein